MTTSILLVEDDPLLGRGIMVNLTTEGYKVSWAENMAKAREQQQSKKFSLIILDRNLPDGNGLDLLKEFRAQGVTTPIVFLTALTDENSVVEGLLAGANDYVRKPFSTKEFLARVQVVLKTTFKTSTSDQGPSFDDLKIDLNQRRIFWREIEVSVNRREFDILLYLVERAEAVVTRQQLVDSIDKEGEIFDRTVDSHVSHVRARLKAVGVSSVKISSVYGVGYRLEKI